LPTPKDLPAFLKCTRARLGLFGIGVRSPFNQSPASLGVWFSKELGIADLHVSFADVSIAGKAHLAGLISVDRFLVDSACDQWKAVRDDAA
jgi:hypothetical protein